MDTPVSRSALYGKLTKSLFRSLESATTFCKLRANPYVELTHWLHQLIQQPENDIHNVGNDSNLLIVFYVQIMPDDFVMQLHRF